MTTMILHDTAPLATLGSSIFTPWVSIGAVTMKITNSTSITSM